MTAQSSDSLLPSPPERSELEARVEQALKVAREEVSRITELGADDFGRSASYGYNILQRMIHILEDGRP